jgi:hypothetical protein
MAAVALLVPAAAPAQTGDTTPPVATITGPPDGSVFRQGEHVPFNWACSDPGDNPSGISQCTIDPYDGIADTKTAGPGKVTLTAVDGAGNRTVVERTFTVESGSVLGASASNALIMPKSCFNPGRTYRAAFNGPDEDPLTSLSLYIGSKRIARRAGSPLQNLVFKLKNLPRKSFTMRAVARTESGLTIKKSRVYKRCR